MENKFINQKTKILNNKIEYINNIPYNLIIKLKMSTLLLKAIIENTFYFSKNC